MPFFVSALNGVGAHNRTPKNRVIFGKKEKAIEILISYYLSQKSKAVARYG